MEIHRIKVSQLIPLIYLKNLIKPIKTKLNKLCKKGVLSKDQMLLIFPPNQQTHSEKFDTTLLVLLIRNCTNIPPPVTGWGDKDPPSTDRSLAANSIRARELRNFFHHTEPKDLDEKAFNAKWSEGENIIKDLGFQYDTQALKKATLDPTRLSVVHSLLQFLQQQQCAIKNELDVKFKSNKDDLNDLLKQLCKLEKTLEDSTKKELKEMKDSTENFENATKNKLQALKEVFKRIGRHL